MRYVSKIVAGPTAAGKTKFAIELAQRLNGELINIDSRQIYKYLDIGTNKGKIELVGERGGYPVYEIEKSGVNIHLLSFVEPDKKFSAIEFAPIALATMKHVAAAGKLPILVGGSGFYLKALLQPIKYANSVPPDPDLREELKNYDVKQLQNMLPNNVLAQMNTSDRQNPVRLIRRIELYRAKLTLQNSKKIDFLQDTISEWEVQKHYIYLPIEDLTKKINKRVLEMWQEGIVDEVRRVLDMGYPQHSPAFTGSGYPAVISHINGKLSAAETITQIQLAHRQVAKRQITWYNKYY